MTQDQKIDKILEMVTEQKIALAETIVYQKNHSDLIKEHAIKHKEIDGKIQVLNDYKNQWIGKTSVWSLIFGTIGAGLFALVKYLTTPHES